MNSSRVCAWAMEPGPTQTAGQCGPPRTEASENQGAVVKPRATPPSRATPGERLGGVERGGGALDADRRVRHGRAQFLFDPGAEGLRFQAGDEADIDLEAALVGGRC